MAVNYKRLHKITLREMAVSYKRLHKIILREMAVSYKRLHKITTNIKKNGGKPEETIKNEN